MFETMKSKVLGAGLGLALISSAVGGVAMTGLTSVGAQTPPANTPAVTQQAEKPEANESAGDAPEANEPQLPGGGHADADGVDVQHDFQGVE
ncbi:MAG: hypothetical protein EPO22_02240 [Dehalococcoidia bacterium]|nr:MAG: hypothetical protein EPO22_02240 [Dehalococcoidia bacterium]